MVQPVHSFLGVDLRSPAKIALRPPDIGDKHPLVAWSPFSSLRRERFPIQAAQHLAKLIPHTETVLRAPAKVVNSARSHLNPPDDGLVGVQEVFDKEHIAGLFAIPINPYALPCQ